MKKLLRSASVISLALSAGLAIAADLPSKKGPPVYVPPPPLWTGFYIGLNAGYAWSQDNSVGITTFPAVDDPTGNNPILATMAAGATSIFNAKTGGFIGGGQVGYNYQLAEKYVVGVEADIQGVAGGRSSASAATAGTAPVVVAVLPNPLVGTATTVLSTSKSLDYLGTLRGRAGYLVTPTLLAYATGGLAYGQVRSGTSIYQDQFTPGGSFTTSPVVGPPDTTSSPPTRSTPSQPPLLRLPRLSPKA